MEVIGRLDRKITIQVATFVADSYGQPQATWVTHATTWAAIIIKKSVENFDAKQETSRKTTQFKIRYRKDLNTEMRISYNGDFYDISGIDEIGRRSGLLITAEAIELADTEVRNG